MKAYTHLYLFEDTDIKITYSEVSPTASLVRIVTNGSDVAFSAQTGKLLALFRAVETAILDGEDIEHVHLSSDSGYEPDGLWDDLDGIDA